MKLANFASNEKTLFDMLSYARPYNSKPEREFVNYYIMPVAKKLNTFCYDNFGNIYIYVGDNYSTAFCAHTDTVRGRAVDKKAKLIYKKGILTNTNGGILGADDTTGCFILLSMITAGIPGMYCFFRAEEIGGKGSDFAATKTPYIFDGISKAISFDRKGYSSIITHQAMGRSCSNVFASALSAQLGTINYSNYTPDDTGVFTDTANLTHLIAECTNLSVGYFSEHTHRERQDVPFVFELIKRLINVNWDALPVDRNTLDLDEDYFFGSIRDAAYYNCDADDYRIMPTDEELNMLGITRSEFEISGLDIDDLIYCLDNAISVREYVWSKF